MRFESSEIPGNYLYISTIIKSCQTSSAFENDMMTCLLKGSYISITDMIHFMTQYYMIIS